MSFFDPFLCCEIQFHQAGGLAGIRLAKASIVSILHVRKGLIRMSANQTRPTSAEPADASVPPLDLSRLAARLSARDAAGNFMSVLTGNESDAELRAITLQFVEACPVPCEQTRCPFRILGGLYHVSSRALINSMSRSGLVSLFEAEVESRQCGLKSSGEPGEQ